MVSKVGTKGVPRAEREGQILDVAADEFGRRGYSGASIAAVAERAGISKPLIYSYFGSKDGLYLSCLRRAGEVLVDAITEVARNTEPTMLLATDTLRVIFTVLEPAPQSWSVLYDPTVPPGGQVAELAAFYRKQIDDLATVGVTKLMHARGNTDPLDISALEGVWTSAVTALVNWWLDHPECSAHDMTARCERLVLALGF